MQWILMILTIGLAIHVHSFPKNGRKTQVYMATIDLDTNRKRNIDPEIILNTGPQIPLDKRKVTQAPDYGDYEDYELTAKPDESTSSSPPKINAQIDIRRTEHTLLDSQFKPHSKKEQKSSSEVRDEVARLMGDLHREELIMRTTVTKSNMTNAIEPTTTMDMMLGNETMFFGDEEGSGEDAMEDDILNSTVTTTRRPLLFTTLIQEVKSVPVTVRPDPFAHLDYDLSDHSNFNKLKPPAAVNKTKPDRLKKFKLHGGAVPLRSTLVKIHPNLQTKGATNAAPAQFKRRKAMRKIKKIDKMRKVKYINQRFRAQNRMRLRKVLSKMLFGPRDSESVPMRNRHTKLKFVGNNGMVTPRPQPKKLVKQRDFNFIQTRKQIPNQNRRDKRDLQVVEPENTSGGGGWDTLPIEKSIIESINFEEPHPAYHLVQVEPSELIHEDHEDYSDDFEVKEDEENKSIPVRSGLVQVSLDGNAIPTLLENGRRLKLVNLNMKSTKKLEKKNKPRKDGEALVVPTARKPTMLELLIGDFLGRVAPTAHNPYLTEEQWS